MSRNELLEGLTGGGSAVTSAGDSGRTGLGSIDDSRDFRDPDEVDFDRIVQAIEAHRAEPPNPGEVVTDPEAPWKSNYLGSTRHLPKGILPGFGESYDDCGRPYLLGCSHGHTHETTRTPGRSTCPFCGAVWARDRAIDAVARLEGYKRYLWASGDFDELYHHHMVVSPDGEYPVEADTEKEAYEKAWEPTKVILQELGAVAGFGMFHSYSGDNSDDDLVDDLGEWKDRLFQGRDWMDDVLEELEHRPHFHAMVISPYMHGQEITKRLYEETGWIVDRIAGEENPKSIQSLEGLAASTSYSISHTMLYEQPSTGDIRSATRWFGIGNFRASPHIKEAAEKAVKSVAKRTLGLPEKDQFCHSDISADGSAGGGLDVTPQLGDGPTSGGDTRGSSSNPGELPSDYSGDLPSAHRGELPIKAPRDRGQLQDDVDEWPTPIPNESRLRALQEASPKELIATYEWITEENVYRIKNDLLDRTPDENVCGEPLLPIHKTIERIDEDPDKREKVDLGRLREDVLELLEGEYVDVDRVQEDVDEFLQEDFDDIEELRGAVGDLIQDHFLGEEHSEIRSDLQAIFKYPESLGGVREVQVDIGRRLGRVVDDLDGLPGYLKPVVNAIDDAGPWIDWDPGPG